MSIREQFRGRSQPTETVRLPHDPTGYARCERAVADAAVRLEQARATGGVDTSRLRSRLADAEEALNACTVIEITIRALPAPEWEALVALHPASEEDAGKGLMWNATTLRPALLEACVVPDEGEAPLSASEWEQIVKDGEIGAGEYNSLCNAAVALNLRSPASAVGKER